MRLYLEVKNHLFVLLGCGHLLEGCKQVLGIEFSVGETNQARCSMVSEVDEHVVISSRLEDSSSSLSLDGSFIAFEDGQEVFGGDSSLGIVEFDSLVDIHSCFLVGGLVEDFSFEGVVDALGEVIINEGNDFLCIKAALDEGVIGVQNIGLMSVVAVSIGASNEHGPVVADRQGHQKAQYNELHVDILLQSFKSNFV